jgi:hypothetical protein
MLTPPSRQAAYSTITAGWTDHYRVNCGTAAHGRDEADPDVSSMDGWLDRQVYGTEIGFMYGRPRPTPDLPCLEMVSPKQPLSRQTTRAQANWTGACAGDPVVRLRGSHEPQEGA